MYGPVSHILLLWGKRKGSRKSLVGLLQTPGSNGGDLDHGDGGEGRKPMYSGYILKMSMNTSFLSLKERRGEGGAGKLLQRTLSSANCPELDKFPTESNSFLVPAGDPEQRGALPCPSPHGTQQASRDPQPLFPSQPEPLQACPNPRKTEGLGEGRGGRGTEGAR